MYTRFILSIETHFNYKFTGPIIFQELNTSSMSVKAGEVEHDDPETRLQKQTKEERRLAEMMIPKKKKRLYDKIMYSKKKKGQEVISLTVIIYICSSYCLTITQWKYLSTQLLCKI